MVAKYKICKYCCLLLLNLFAIITTLWVYFVVHGCKKNNKHIGGSLAGPVLAGPVLAGNFFSDLMKFIIEIRAKRAQYSRTTPKVLPSP